MQDVFPVTSLWPNRNANTNPTLRLTPNCLSLNLTLTLTNPTPSPNPKVTRPVGSYIGDCPILHFAEVKI